MPNNLQNQNLPPNMQNMPGSMTQNPNLTRGAGPFFGGVSNGTGIKPQPPKQPQKPTNANNRWAQTSGILDEIKANRPKLRAWEVNKEANAIWRDMAPEIKQPFIDEFEADKLEYNEKMVAYYSSQEYMRYQSYCNMGRAQPNLETVTDGRFKGADLDELYWALRVEIWGSSSKKPD